jgi:hypothetical protein
MTLGAGEDGRLWLREAAPGSGYALAVIGRRLLWERHDLRETTPLAGPVKLKHRGALELRAVAAGGALIGAALAAEDGSLVATIFTGDPFFPPRPLGAACPPSSGGFEGPAVSASFALGPAWTWRPLSTRAGPLAIATGPGYQRVVLSAGLAFELACLGLEPRAVRRGSVTPPRMGELVGSFKTPEALAAALEAINLHHPVSTALAILGTSWEQRPILALQVQVAGSHAPALLLDGAHHGNEPLSTEAVLDAALALLEGPSVARRLAAELEVWLVPQVNPDGAQASLTRNDNSGRKNGRDHDGNGQRDPDEGVDLNRNYPFRWGALEGRGGRPWRAHPFYRGPAPGSEPETRAMMRLALQVRPALGVSFHTGSVAILAPYTTEGARDPEPWLVGGLAQAVAAQMPPHPSGNPWDLRRNLYPVDGTSQDWLFHAVGTAALLVELTGQSPRSPEARRAILQASRAAWTGLAQAWLGAPRVRGGVVDARGAPVQAELRVPGIASFEGEAWWSRCPDGRFDRLVPPGSPVRIEVKDPAGPWIAIAVAPEQVSGRVEVEIALPQPVEASHRCADTGALRAMSQ